MIIENGLVFRGERGFIKEPLYIQDGFFSDEANGRTLDAEGCYVIPGLVDVHFHGAAGHDFCDGTPEALASIAAYELANGVTSICPATMTLGAERLKEICRNAADASAAGSSGTPDGARLVGIHLEGPFIAPGKKGAQNPDYIVRPSTELLQELIEASNSLVRLITVAPEVDGAADFIREASGQVHVSIGHTACDYDTAARAIALGADHLTHTFNAMQPLSHRAPGPIAAGAMAGSVMAEVICDGIHVHPSMIKCLLRLFGPERVVFISDSMRATGMPDGTYDLGGLAVSVAGPYAKLADGTIAGSVSNLMQCMKNAVSMGIPLETAVACATVNPARSIGADDLVGSLDCGKRADCVLLDKDSLEIKHVIKDGVLL